MVDRIGVDGTGVDGTRAIGTVTFADRVTVRSIHSRTKGINKRKNANALDGSAGATSASVVTAAASLFAEVDAQRFRDCLVDRRESGVEGGLRFEIVGHHRNAV